VRLVQGGLALEVPRRRLVELGLTVKTKARPTGRLRAALVADLAAEAIDSLSPEKRKALGLKAKTGKT